ncbi:calcineurin-like phosphoesterase [Hirsutella rhossiliensis]|uniref:Calcineurin-like phosphoesterase domain-containing protein n=1 Tax=Hirsutella rhossiliensis TaxID=111463 RepID=A0A9P8MQX0_9HYPO|nr:calcineurin-like phosphoesterase domain-containing protein [Hirsutella rhossiliensis]KAH0959595.1 calcineurin-like phosphoesterase domain-containing protein [Hirsutella rhossiliensis]
MTGYKSVAACDILLHAGDLSQFGTFAEIQAQLSWLAAQPHPHKVVIAGNHDLLLDSVFVSTNPDRELDRHPGQRRNDLDWGGVQYLERGSLDIAVEGKNRSIRVFGSPWTPRCGNWAFQYGKGDGDRETLGTAPADTDVMLMHGPPKGHLDDGGKGCGRLLAEVWRVRPKVVVCGHIHAGRGEEWLRFDHVDSWYENVMLGRRRWVSVLCLVLCHVWLRVTRTWGVAPSQEQTRGTRLINAAMVGGRGNVDHREAFVAAI